MRSAVPTHSFTDTLPERSVPESSLAIESITVSFLFHEQSSLFTGWFSIRPSGTVIKVFLDPSLLLTSTVPRTSVGLLGTGGPDIDKFNPVGRHEARDIIEKRTSGAATSSLIISRFVMRIVAATSKSLFDAALRYKKLRAHP